MIRKSYATRIMALGGVALSVTVAGSALAQEASPTVSSSGELEEIMVTGTRIEVGGFTAPTPVRVIGEDLMQARHPVDATELVRGVPAFTVSGSTQFGVGQASNAGQGFLNLRLGGTNPRTLILVDGHQPVRVISP